MFSQLSRQINDYDENPIVGTCFSENLDKEGTYLLMIIGPKESLYQDLILYFEVIFPSNYPLQAPTVYPINQIYHPNISISDTPSSRRICVSYLNNWKPSNSIREMIVNLVIFLSYPNFRTGYQFSEYHERNCEFKINVINTKMSGFKKINN